MRGTQQQEVCGAAVDGGGACFKKNKARGASERVSLSGHPDASIALELMQVPNQTKYTDATNQGGNDAAWDGASPGSPPTPRRRRAHAHPKPAVGPHGSGAKGEGRRQPQRTGGLASGPGPGKGRRRPHKHNNGLHSFP
jgi:hypothetical protein